MGTGLGLAGSKRITASGELNAAGERLRVYMMNVLCGAGGNGVVSLKSGGVAGDIWIQQVGTASQGVTFDYTDKGVVLPNGCYVTIDANVVSVVITYEKEIK